MPKARSRIGELLIGAGLISPKHLREALEIQAKQGGKIAEILISLGYIDAPSFLRFLQRESGAPSIEVGNYDINRDIIALVPREFALRHEILPIDKMANLLTVGMTCPLDSKSIEELEAITKLKIKPILCSAPDLRAAIDRYYREPGIPASVDLPVVETKHLEAPLRLAGTAALIRNIRSFPVLPETVKAVREAMSDPTRSTRDVAEIIARDPGMAAKVLSVANSAAYGLAHRVGDLTLAAALMGLNDVYAIVLSASVVNQLGRKVKFNHERFSADSLNCAAAARAIALAAGKGTLTSVFSAGLLHDIGRLALAEAAPGNYDKIDPALRDLELIAAEESLMGIAHPEAGYELSTHWNLPSEITEPIRYHHYPELCDTECETLPIVALAVVWNGAAEKGIDDEREVLLNTSELIARAGIGVEAARSVLTWLKTFVPARLRPNPV